MDTIINYTIGILGLILAYYFYKKSIRIKEPVYSTKSNNLISGSVSTLENLNISYKRQKVENLTVSKILFYNRGAETITRQDTKTLNHLSISSETCRILDGSILQVNNPSNNLTVQYDNDNKNVHIDFDYLDTNQGAVIQVIHTGLSSNDLWMDGAIMGVQRLVNIPLDRLMTKQNRKSLYPTIARVLIISISLGFYIYLSSRPNNYGSLITVLLVFLILPTIAILWGSEIFYYSKIPKGLEQFDA